MKDTGLVSVKRWSARWRQTGHASEHIMYEDRIPVLFLTRKQARLWINEHYGYIRGRKDLRKAPHHWRIPIPIRVQVVEYIGK